MSAQVEHKNHHAASVAYGTGGHRHHRAILERSGCRVSFWTCDLGNAPHHACPDEPDPVARLAAKVAEARGRRVAQTTTPPVCSLHPVERQRTYDPKPGIRRAPQRVCLDCQRERDRRNRFAKAADRVERMAMRAA